MSNAAEVFVACLEKFNVTHVFGVPGEETLDILAAIESSKIKFIACRHEQSASIMAAVQGRLTGIPGVSLTTLGPGALNAINGVAYAYLGQMPMLLISGQKPVHEIKQGNFQMLDVVDAMQPVTLISQRLMKANATPSMVYHVLNTAASSPMGPVHIELAEDIAKEPVSDGLSAMKNYSINDSVLASDAAIDQVAQRINAAKNPLLICGQHANEASVSVALQQWVKSAHLPFVTTQMGKGAVDERMNEYLGTTALSDEDFVHHMAKQADLIIMVGHNESEKPPMMLCVHQQDVIHISEGRPAINETYFPNQALIGDVTHSIERLQSQVKACKENQFAAIKTAFLKHEQTLLKTSHPLQIIEQVRAAMPNDGIVTLDNGMYKIWFTRHYRAHGPNTLLLDNALATMGAGLPSAIASQLVYPDRQVLSVCGDGGFIMGGQDFETAIRLKLDLVVMVLRDNQFGMISWKQQMDGYDDFGLDFGNPDFAALAESFGAHGHRVNEISQLAETINSCFADGGVHLIEVPIDYNSNSVLNDLSNVVESYLGDE